MDGGAWWAVVHGVAESQTRLSDFTYVCTKSLQLCLTLCDPIDGSLPGSSVPGILQARILEELPFPSPFFDWVIYFSGIELQVLLVYF